MNEDTLLPVYGKNYFEYGVDKIYNTYLFTGNLFYKDEFRKGGIEIAQYYRGLGIQQNSLSFRDDESFLLRYHYPLFQNISLITETNWIFSADTRTIGQNQLNRLNGMAGLSYNVNDSKIELTAGYEHNKQIDVISPGLIMDLKSSLRNIRFSNYSLNARLDGELLKLNLDRINSDIDFYSSLSGNFVNDNSFGLDFGYRLMNRDLLSTWISESDLIPIERRLEQNLFPGINVGFTILPGLKGVVNLQFIDMLVSKSYNQPVDEFAVSKVKREFHEFQFAVNSELRYNSTGFLQSIGLQYSSRSEVNRVFKKFYISEIEEERLKELEATRDNISSRTKLFTQTLWTPADDDTLRFDFSTSIYRYDTPSEKNNDDRDEFNLFANISYMHKLNSNLSAGVFTNVQMLHLVFLNAERSAMNNWNRIIRFGPQVKWKNKFLYLNPSFEIIANYTIYDFDDLTDNIRSYSFRQIGYRDSLCIYLDRDVSLQGRIHLRYYERGILYWETFSESPQNNNIEYFIKMLAYSKINDVISVGAGIRIYSLQQRNIANNLPSSLSFSQYSIGPETVMTIKFLNGSSISLQGWYEFQYINKLQYNEIPNLFLITNVAL